MEELSGFGKALELLEKGIYVEQLERWFKIFPKENFFICKTEDLNSHTLMNIFKFLDLPKYDIENITSSNIGKYDKMDDSTREKLIEFFSSYNSKLSRLLNMDFNWNQ